MSDLPRGQFVQARTGACAVPAPRLAPEALTFFVPVRLVNALNAREHAMVTARRASRERDAVPAAVLAALRADRSMRWAITAPPSQPKAITLVAHVHQPFDSHDNLRAACKHLVDGLVDAGLIDDDRDAAGHAFTYDQVVDRRRRGVEITVRLQTTGEPA